MLVTGEQLGQFVEAPGLLHVVVVQKGLDAGQIELLPGAHLIHMRQSLV